MEDLDTKTRPEVNNPYKYALRVIRNRLRWDLSNASWQSRKRLRGIKNSHKGKAAVIICNGPSLLQCDFSTLAGTFTFGLNKINLLFDKRSFRPSCVVSINQFVLEQNAPFFNETDIPLFLDGFAADHVRQRENVTFLHSSQQAKFAEDCSMSIKAGGTVTFVAMQLAYHMGFRKIALVGCDHTFAQKGPANKVVRAEKSDPSHFDPNYFSNGVPWQLPDLAASEYFYSMAHEVFQAAGGEITNCTDGGELDIFPRQDLKEWVASNLK